MSRKSTINTLMWSTGALALLGLSAPASAAPPQHGVFMELEYALDDHELVSKVDYTIENRAFDPDSEDRPLTLVVVGVALNPLLGHSGAWEEVTYEVQDTPLTLSTGTLSVAQTDDIMTGVIGVWAYTSDQSECVDTHGVGSSECDPPLSVQYEHVLLQYKDQDAESDRPAGWIQASYADFLANTADIIETDEDGYQLYIRDRSSAVEPGTDTSDGFFQPRTPLAEEEQP